MWIINAICLINCLPHGSQLIKYSSKKTLLISHAIVNINSPKILLVKDLCLSFFSLWSPEISVPKREKEGEREVKIQCLLERMGYGNQEVLYYTMGCNKSVEVVVKSMSNSLQPLTEKRAQR